MLSKCRIYPLNTNLCRTFGKKFNSVSQSVAISEARRTSEDNLEPSYRNTFQNVHWKLTAFSWDLNESLHTALAIVPLRCQRGDVVPAHGGHDVQHGLGLIGVGRHNPGEEVVPGVIAQFRRCGCIADLRDLLKERKNKLFFMRDFKDHIF